MDDDKPKHMDISAQERAFAGFIRLATWGSIIAIGVLIFLALANA